MTFDRITRASDVLAVWPIFDEGFRHLEVSEKLNYEELQAKKLVCRLATDLRSGFVGIVTDDITGEVIAFVLMHETTLPFFTFRTFSSCAVYYRHTFSSALLLLFGGFEKWAKTQHIRRYTLLTRRTIHVAKRTFAQPKYGFDKMSLTFEKTL